MNLRGWRLFTVLTLAANIVFAVLIGLELAHRESAQIVMPTAKSKIPGLRDKPITLPPRPRAQVESPTTNWPPFRWSSVQSPNYTNYVANLRKIGCPPDTVEAIIRGATWFELATFIHAYATEKHPLLWDCLTGSTNAQAQLERAVEPIQEADNRRSDLLEDLFHKPAPSAEQRRNIRLKQRQSELQTGPYAHVAADTLSMIAAIDLTIADRQAEIRTNTPPNRRNAELTALSAERESALTNLLSPAELKEFKLRSFVELQERGQTLRGLAIVASNSADYSSLVASYTNQTAFSQALGPNRDAKWTSIQSTDIGSVNTFLAITRKFSLNSDIAISAAKANSAYRKEAGEIDNDQKLLPRERRVLKDLLEQQRIEKLRSLLGSDAWETYRFHHEY